MEFYAHQQEVIDEKNRPDRLKFGNFRGTGSGKTRGTVAVAEGVTLVVCPKTQWQDQIWPTEWEFQNKNPDDFFCLSYEQFKKAIKEGSELSICGGRYPDTIILDEVHKATGVLPDTRQKNYKKIPKTSQLFEALIYYIDRAKPKRIHPLTATPASSPMALYALGRILGRNFDYFQFREAFYYPMTLRGYERWLPKFRWKPWPNSKPEVQEMIRRERARSIELAAQTKESLGYTGTLQDWFDVPEQTFKTHEVGVTAAMKAKYKELKLLYPDPLVQAGQLHALEQGIFKKQILKENGEVETVTELVKENKTEAVQQYADEFGRIVVFCRFTAQIEMLKKYFEKDYRVLTLTGATKDRKALLEEANDGDDCILIAQMQISSGWEVPDFPCMVFASMDYSYTNYMQAIGRILRAKLLKKNLYVFLVAGAADELTKSIIADKEEFSEAQFNKELSKKYKM